MKKDLQPKLNNVCFVDASTKTEFLTRSTMKSDETKTIDGVEYYVVSAPVSSDSHPYFTGEQKHFDTAGRIEKFERKFGAKKPAAKAKAAPKKEAAKAEPKAADAEKKA